jgi:hypothetical protein
LVINEPEAALVRDIFTRYVEHGSAAQLVRELQIEGHTTKAWVTQGGRHRQGRTIDQQYLFSMMRNRLYLGEITNHGQSYPGQHQAIIGRELWDAVHAIIEKRKKGPRVRSSENPALLAGLLYAPDGQRLIPSHTTKKDGRRYRYYVPYLEKRQGAGASLQPGRRGMGPLPAAEIESAVLAQVHQVLQAPEMIIGVWQAGLALPDRDAFDEPTTLIAMRQISTVWQHLFPAEQHRIMRLLIERVQLRADGLDIIWRDDSWHQFRRELERHPFVEEQRDAATEGIDEMEMA